MNGTPQIKTKTKTRLFPEWLKGASPFNPQTRRRLKHDRIAAVASSLFAKQGFGGTTINQIADKAGVATGTIYQHFSSKRQIILSIMTAFFDRSSELPAESRDPRSAIRMYLAQFVQPEASHRCAFRAWQEIVSIDSELARSTKRSIAKLLC